MAEIVHEERPAALALSDELVGREAELDQLRTFAATLGSGPAAAWISGEAGIGKTRLWRHAVGDAEAAGVRVLAAACAEIELPIAFGTLADLFEDALDDLGERLAAPQRRALAVAFGREDDEEMRPDSLALARAAVALLAVLAERAPILIAVDDVQWLDTASRRTLLYALRRLPTASVGTLITSRGGEDAADPLALADVYPRERIRHIVLGGLSAGAVGHLVREQLGHLPRPTIGRIQQASGGNPMFALELARVALASATSPVAPLELPSSLEALVADRVAGLPPEIVSVVELTALLDRPTPALLGRCLDGLDRAEALLDAGIRAGALTLAPDGVVRFGHPLLASAVVGGMPFERRRALHRMLASRVDGTIERARHAALATGEADSATAALVEEAAATAAARGALDTAAALCEEAARLTPSELEPLRQRRVLQGAAHLAATGEFAAACAMVEPLLGTAASSEITAEALLLRADAEVRDRRRLVELLEAALVAAEGDPRLRWHALIRLAQHAGWVSGDVSRAVATARDALQVAEALDDDGLVTPSRAALSYYEAALGRRPTVVPAADARRSWFVRLPWWQLSTRLAAGFRLLWAGELDRARAVLAADRAELTEAGREARAGFTIVCQSELEWRAGRFPEAAALAEEATARLGAINPTTVPRLLVCVSAGRVDEARAVAAGVIEYCGEANEHIADRQAHWALGLLELSLGDPERAWVELAAATELLDASGIREPGLVPVAPDAAEALVALGRLDEAEQTVVRLEQDAASLAHRWALPAAARSRALLLLGQGEAREAAELAGRAAAGFEAAGFPLDHARALLAVGEAHRRIGERRLAGERIAAATAMFRQLGAPLWLARAERELRRASPRPGRERDALTAAETRVAALVAAGRTNKETAAELYTTVATVEAHLTRIYRKLGIRSRTELASRVADGRLPLAKESGSP